MQKVSGNFFDYILNTSTVITTVLSYRDGPQDKSLNMTLAGTTCRDD